MGSNYLRLGAPLSALLLAGVAALAPGEASAVPVDLELVMAVDTSSSVSSSEFNLQRQGYEDAFRSPTIINAIQSGAIGSIAASLVYWSSSSQQQQAVGWTQISDSTSANSFADAIAAAARPYNGSTSISEALNFSAPLVNGNGYEGTRTVIDVSGDGTNNSGGSLSTARTNALSIVDAINGLAIGSASLLTYYEDNVIGGPNSFAIQANSFDAFGAAVSNKLQREITQVPEPATLALMGIAGLAGIGASRAKKNRP